MTRDPIITGPAAVQVGEDPERLPPSLRLALIARVCAPWESELLSLGETLRRLDTILWFASGGEDGHDWGYR